ncbi:plasmid partitioning protein RepB [Pseudovibrio ascidiaceicola]|uniref:plasmid partitioning protein RepB n=1 Tax=Pseudovibrio ascidiaceicola TaxID=285279 RepID=UPI003D35A2F5
MPKSTKQFEKIWASTPNSAPAAPTMTKEKPVSTVPPKSAGALLGEASKNVAALAEKKYSPRDIRSLDPASCLPSIVLDRVLEEDDAELESLKDSIKSQSQQVPILVRPHLEEPDLFQIAYGHRRVKACRALGLAVQAIVRDLNDEQLVIAQGKENEERKNLSAIQKALFVKSLDEKGFPNKIIVEAVGAGKPPLISKLKKIVRSIPMDIIEKIGVAPNTSRSKWETLAIHCDENPLQQNSLQKRINALSRYERWQKADSDTRFKIVMSELTKKTAEKKERGELLAHNGKQFAEISSTKTNLKLALMGEDGQRFAEFLRKEMPGLVKRFAENEPSGEKQ